MSYIIMILLLSVLIITHELGHYAVARWCGVKVERFGLGLPFGPTLWRKRIGDTEYCLHALLFGGYVAFPDDDPDSTVPPNSLQRYENQPLLNRAAIAIAGITVNAITAYLLMTALILGYGAKYLPVEVWGFRPVVSESIVVVPSQLPPAPEARYANLTLWPVMGQAQHLSLLSPLLLKTDTSSSLMLLPAQGSVNQKRTVVVSPAPALVGGLQQGDQVQAVNGNAITGFYGDSFDTFKAHVKANKSQPMTLSVKRDGATVEVNVQPNHKGELGLYLNPFVPEVVDRSLNPLQALGAASGFLHGMVVKNFEGLGQLATGQIDPAMVDGPIGIVSKGGQIIEQQGMEKGLLLTAIISMILAVMNLLPIPPLDGSLLVFIGLEAIKGKPLAKQTQERILQAGFLGLMALMVMIVGNDLLKMVSGSL
jgi:regulator of sigma E protease